MAIKIYLLITLLIPPALSQCNQAKTQSIFKRSIYDFNTNLVTRISQETENHFVASSLSVWTLLAAISEGATGNTYDEIRDVLRLNSHKCFINKNYGIIKEIVSKSEGSVMERSGAIFIDQNLAVKESFVQKIARYNITEVQTVSFDKFDDTAFLINNYVKDATHGVIEEIVAPEDLEGKYLLLTDVIYFKGVWKSQFNPEHTRVQLFKDETGNNLGHVNMMFLKEKFNIADMKILQANVLELPYKGDKFSMLIFLPYEGATLSDVIERIKRISVGSIYSVLNNEKHKEVAVNLPRFKVSTNLENLKELVTDMGIRDMFDPSRAQFPDISDFSLYVSDMIQKADIEVTEEGTVAAAVTSIRIESRMLPRYERFTVDRPFLFMIVHKKTEYVMFTGAYSKPSLF